jgi:hypothetical protein
MAEMELDLEVHSGFGVVFANVEEVGVSVRWLPQVERESCMSSLGNAAVGGLQVPIQDLGLAFLLGSELEPFLALFAQRALPAAMVFRLLPVPLMPS